MRKVKKNDTVGTTAGTLWRQWGLRGELHLKSRAWNERLERREVMKSTIETSILGSQNGPLLVLRGE